MAEARLNLIRLFGSNMSPQDFQDECHQIADLLRVYHERLFRRPMRMSSINRDVTPNELQQMIDQLKLTHV